MEQWNNGTNHTMKAIHLKITGHVQGVCFRAETKNKANELGLMGWVKNCHDGSVEMLAQGSDDALKKCEKWCRKGPSMAKVDEVIITECETEPRGSFVIVY
jgi:acylphosphatase